MKFVLYALLVCFVLACNAAPDTDNSDIEMTEEEMDQQVEEQLEEDQERYDSMKRELGL